jgi:endo-1,4-beta-mannosidase
MKQLFIIPILLFVFLSSYSQKEKLVFGCNFIPSTAINQLQMWQAESFDTATIARELKLASSIGMNVVRVYLHDLVHKEDSTAFLNRINIFLNIASRYGIKTMFVFFDSCWDPFPFSGKQPDPVPFRHNSHWVQSPGYIALKDSTQYLRLGRYVKAVVKRFAKDNRIYAWDVWNEPDFGNEDNSYGKEELPDKRSYVLRLLKQSFTWVRSQHPTQPLTSGIWKIYGNWNTNYSFDEIEKAQVGSSDFISFHYYGNAIELEKRIVWIKQFNKPIVCTEYLARNNGSTFEDCLPVFIKHGVGAINWGLVSGKTQTIYPWDSWSKDYSTEPAVWHHDIFRKDGIPYRPEEVQLIKGMVK